MKFPFLLMINQQAEIDIHLSYHNMLRNSKFTTYSYQDTILTSMWQHRNNCPIYNILGEDPSQSNHNFNEIMQNIETNISQ